MALVKKSMGTQAQRIIEGARFLSLVAMIVFHYGASPVSAEPAPPVLTMRVPNGGVQPQVAVDVKGVVHMIYMAGQPATSDIFYVRSADGGKTFSAPIRVNHQPGSAIAIGTVRGAHLAVGRNGRVHVAWMGSGSAKPKAVGRATPMLYTRSTADGAGFEPERNVLQSKVGLDGGASVAADTRGNVWVAWHAPATMVGDEQSRRVWVVHSSDDGATFGAEQEASDSRGACGCCGMRLFSTAEGTLYVLYRSADHMINRDMTLLRFDKSSALNHADTETVGPMKSAVCVMSTAAFAPAGKDALAAWETAGQVFWTRLSRGEMAAPKAAAAPGEGNSRKHPALASNANGQTILVWTEGTGWNRGGSVVWQVYDLAGNPLFNGKGRADNLPAWGSCAAFARGDGVFVVVY